MSSSKDKESRHHHHHHRRSHGHGSSSRRDGDRSRSRSRSRDRKHRDGHSRRHGSSDRHKKSRSRDIDNVTSAPIRIPERPSEQGSAPSKDLKFSPGSSTSKPKLCSQTAAVHSSNAWEDVDMEQEKKEKFLRLMGAAKAQPAGRFHIGEASTTHSRAGDASKDLETKLEDQYKTSMDMRISKPRHAGFGFSDETVIIPKPSTQASDVQEPSTSSSSKNYMSMFVKGST